MFVFVDIISMVDRSIQSIDQNYAQKTGIGCYKISTISSPKSTIFQISTVFYNIYIMNLVFLTNTQNGIPACLLRTFHKPLN